MNTKKTITTALAIASLGSVANAAITQWETASQAIATNVTTSTNGGAGWTLAGAGVAYDYGDLSNGDIGSVGPGTTIEYIFNLTDSGASIGIGGVNGWNNSEANNFKLEQWNNTGNFGITLPGVADYNYTSASVFNTEAHVVFVNNTDGTMELFVNGVSQGASSRGGSWVTNGGVGTLGSNINGSDAATGTFAGVASYDSALTQSDISALYAAYSAPVPEPASTALLGLGGLALILRRRK